MRKLNAVHGIKEFLMGDHEFDAEFSCGLFQVLLKIGQIQIIFAFKNHKEDEFIVQNFLSNVGYGDPVGQKSLRDGCHNTHFILSYGGEKNLFHLGTKNKL